MFPVKNFNCRNEETIAALLAELAHQEHKSVSGFAKELILEALERREAMSLPALAEIRDHAASKKVKHSDVWNLTISNPLFRFGC